MGSLLMREKLPARRHSWTQKVRIDGQSIHITVGEYEDGRPGEIFIDVSKQGTFLRGVMGSLARMVSIALQCGSGVEVVVHALRGLDYPPKGRVEGSSVVTECLSVTDWIASELEGVYLNPPSGIDTLPLPQEDAGAEPTLEEEPATTGKNAGWLPETWRGGA